MARFAGKVAIVTGAGRGIGRHEAILLAREGARVVVNDLGGGPDGGGGDVSIAQAVADEIRAFGGEAVAETSSIGSMAGGEAVVEAALDAFGRLDILINNAGIARAVRVDQTSEEDWDAIHTVNLKGAFATIRAAARVFIAQKSGVIVNTGSPSGFGQYANLPYCAAKEGVIGLTRAVARDLGAFGVRCNAIRPQAAGSTMGTEKMFEAIKISENELQIPAVWRRRSLSPHPEYKPESVAALAAWLCSDACGQVNGREFYVAGPEIGLLPEPELQRAVFNPGGWDIEALDAAHIREYLVGDIHNPFTGRGPAGA